MTDDPGLSWLANLDWPPSLVFTQGVSEEQVFRAFGSDPAEAIPRGPIDPSSSGSGPMIRVGRAGDWIFVVQEDAEPTQGIRPEVLRRVSAGGEAVALYADLGKLNHEFVHAADGVVVTALTTSVPPHWRGSEPDRLEPVARELGLTEDSSPPDGLTYWEAVLLMAESVFGMTLNRSDLDQPLPCARVLPVLEDLGLRPADDRVFRTGDPVIDLMLDHASPEMLATVVAMRMRRLMAETGLDSYPELVAAADAAIAGQPRAPEDDEPAGLALRRLTRGRGEAVRLLRLLLDGRPPGQIFVSELHLRQRLDAKGQDPLAWRAQAITDFQDVEVDPAGRLAAEEAGLTVPEPVRGRRGSIDAKPVRDHVSALIAAGVEVARITKLAGCTPVYLDRLLSGRFPVVDVRRARVLLEIPLPE